MMTDPTTTEIEQAGGLFTGTPQYETFARIRERWPVREMAPSARPQPLPDGARIELPTTYRFGGRARSLHGLLGATHTSALLVLKDGAVRYEQYWLSGGRNVQWMSMSVAKSYISALVGIALADGAITALEEPIDRYVPTLRGTGYEGVCIRDVLQMSSGVCFVEDYTDPEAEIARLAAATAPGGSLDAFMATMVSCRPPGTLCMYSSADTQALGMLIAGATGRTVADYMQERLCEPLGMESPGYWVVDSFGREMAFAGLLLTARDFARIGELYRNGGDWRGRRIVPSDYVAASVRADAPHLQPGAPIVGDHALGPGYGYQWWLPAGERGAFSAIGVYNQYVYVDPTRGVVVVKLSANPAYGLSSEEEDNKDNENLAAIQAICDAID